MAEKKENWFKKTWGAVCKYFRELKSELKKVTWPTPKQVAKNTLIVVACVLVVGVFIWLFDFLAQTGVTALIGLTN
jgi:preprotein translocase subunit SecE